MLPPYSQGSNIRLRSLTDAGLPWSSGAAPADSPRHSKSRRAGARPPSLSGLRDPVVHSSVCKAAPKDINWRLTIGFEFRIWRELCWHLYRCLSLARGFACLIGNLSPLIERLAI
jgi:hypothetical protein